MENVVVASTELFSGQSEMDRDVMQIEKVASEMVIETEDDRDKAALWLQQIKKKQKEVKEAWEPFLVDAKAIYDRVRGQKATMLEPLEKAERAIKQKVSNFIAQEEKKRAEEAERLRKLAVQEAERKLIEAAEAEESGDVVSAGMSMMEAEVYEQAAQTTRAEALSKAKGMSAVDSWEIVSIDNEKVPVMFQGMEIRPVDERAVKRLIKASKGTIQIPGISYKKTSTIRVRT